MSFRHTNEHRRWRAGLAASLFLTSTVAYSFYCPPQYQESWVSPQFSNATAALNAALTAVDTALSSQLELNGQRLQSAIAILTKQKALAGNQVSDGSRTAAQMTATALNVLAQTERVKQARFDYGGEFGQGFSPCRVYAARQVIANRDAELTEERRERVMTEINAAPGRYADPIQTQAAQVAAHKDFCTQDQVASGLCKTVGSIPGADLTVGTLFTPAMEGEKLYSAKVAFVNNAVGLTDGVVPQGAAKTPAAAAYSLAKARKDALVSPALASLKEIQLDYSGVDTAHGGKDLPLAVHFQNEVKRYAGNSPEYDSWAKVMSGQNERGAMVELLKVKSLDLAIQEKQYRQYERMEAQLAALVAMEVNSSGAVNQTANAAERAAKQNVNNAIK